MRFSHAGKGSGKTLVGFLPRITAYVRVDPGVGLMRPVTATMRFKS
jgi:hypothetical protein